MPIIRKINAREILDSRGNPTIEVDVITENFRGTASVPSGASTGIHEALELRDKGKRYNGMGVQKAIKNVKTKIAPLLKGLDCTRQREIDDLMIKKDGTKNKRKLGANAMLAVSIACCKVAAQAENQYLFNYINLIFTLKKIKLPLMCFNLINGGRHADNKLCIQEFMVTPRFNSASKNIRAGSEIYHQLKLELHKQFGKGATNVGDEGGFAPTKIRYNSEVLKILTKSIKDAGYKRNAKIALDAAASEFYKNKKYVVDGKRIGTDDLVKYYQKLTKRLPIFSIEDPFEQEDFSSFAELKKKSKTQIVGDDLTVTNTERIEQAIEEDSCNCLLLKINQIGTLTEALGAAKLAYKNKWKVMVSHRSGDTEDTFIADLAVGIGADFIKSGAPCRGERTSKYNRLIRIEELIRER